MVRLRLRLRPVTAVTAAALLVAAVSAGPEEEFVQQICAGCNPKTCIMRSCKGCPQCEGVDGVAAAAASPGSAVAETAKPEAASMTSAADPVAALPPVCSDGSVDKRGGTARESCESWCSEDHCHRALARELLEPNASRRPHSPAARARLPPEAPRARTRRPRGRARPQSASASCARSAAARA